MDWTTFNGFDVALGALLALLLMLVAFASYQMRKRRAESPCRERASLFDFKLAPDLADERELREFRKANAYRDHYFGGAHER